MATDPTQSITLRNRWGNEYKRRWRRVIEEVRKDVNANLNNLIDRFVVGDNGRWMLPFIRETVAKSERLASGDVGGTLRLSPEERDELVEELHAEALQDLRNIKDEVANQSSSASAQVIVDTPDERRDISDVVGVVGAIGFLRPDTVPNQVKAITDRINKIGITRSITSVAVRVVGGISIGITRIAKSIGAATVGVQAEQFTTAGDNRVCPLCIELETVDRFGLGEGVWPLGETSGIIPVHPRCRCRWTLVRVQVPIFNEQKPEFEELEKLFLANGWNKEAKNSLISLPKFFINKGEQGDRGPQGFAGKDGRDGKDGVIEIITMDGDRGARGKTGRRGERGPRGFIGNQGERGPIGPVGPKGDMGQPGEAGEDGRGISSVSYDKRSSELIVKYTDGKEDRFKIPLVGKRPFLGGGGDRIGNYPFESLTQITITGVTKAPLVRTYNSEGNAITHTGLYIAEAGAYAIEFPTAQTGTVSIIPQGSSLVPSFDPIIDVLKLITTTNEDIVTTGGENIITVVSNDPVL